jgi:hypothetical protein
MAEHPLCSGPACPDCAQQRARTGFWEGVDLPAHTVVTCPECGHRFTPGGPQRPVRVTETVTALDAASAGGKKPYGDVEYADPGYQDDGTRRYPLDTEDHVRAAWSYINQARNAAKYSAADLKKVKARIKAAMRRLDITVSENSCTEAVINGRRSFDDIRELVRTALRARLRMDTTGYGEGRGYLSIIDIGDTEVVYADAGARLWQCSYAITGDQVQLGDAEEVVRAYAPAGADTTPQPDPGPSTERALIDTHARVLEAKGRAGDGGRIFRVRIIAYGESRNGRRYTETVLRAAAPLYEGAKAFDHHRSTQEMISGTIAGLVGYYRNVQAGDTGLDADLCLLPSATHAAEALDATLAAQAEGVDPLIGISHDAYATFTSVTAEHGRLLQECTAISVVNSADLVAQPAAGGQATRVVAGGGINPDSTKEPDVATTTADVLAALTTASTQDLAAVGLCRVSESTTTPAAGAVSAGPSTAGATTETAQAGAYPRDSFVGRLLVTQKLAEAGLPATATEAITASLPARITEADVDLQIAAIKASLGIVERAGLTPTATGTAQVTQEALDKKKAALDALFAGDYASGYRSFREAFVDITGRRPRSFDEDFNRTILRESAGYDSGHRTTESLLTTSWDAILGDSITRRMVAEYARPNLQTWRMIVSSIVPVNDFRAQRLDRLGGYGTLPAVNQGAPYQPLSSPADEEASYALSKRGGTEDLTLEMIANDDLRAIARIPTRLGLSAAQTLFRFVWDILPTNAATSYDSVALFHGSHANTDNPAVLGQSTLSTGRRKMRQQAAYGDSTDVLSIVPAVLVVPSALEEIAFQLCTSAVAIPSTPAGPSDAPNIHQGLKPVVIDYYTDTNDWFLVADPSLCPTIEIGFYQGRQDPELFTQADPSVGSMFNADKLTWKIRHIYSGAVIDHRGFYRGAN